MKSNNLKICNFYDISSLLLHKLLALSFLILSFLHSFSLCLPYFSLSSLLYSVLALSFLNLSLIFSVVSIRAAIGLAKHGYVCQASLSQSGGFGLVCFRFVFHSAPQFTSRVLLWWLEKFFCNSLSSFKLTK